MLFGSRTPVVLRSWGDGFIVIGDAYMEGIMKGEIVTTFDESEKVYMSNWDTETSSFKSKYGEYKVVEVSIH